MKTFITLTFIFLISGCASNSQPLATNDEIRRLVNAYEAYCFDPVADNQNIQLLTHANQLKTLKPSAEPGLSELHRTLSIKGIPWTHQPRVYELAEQKPQQPAIFLSTFLPDTCIVSMKMNPKSLYDLIRYLEKNFDSAMMHSSSNRKLLVKGFHKKEAYLKMVKAKENQEDIKDKDKIVFTFTYLYEQEMIGLMYIPVATFFELITVQLRGKLGRSQSIASHPVKSLIYQLDEENPPNSGL